MKLLERHQVPAASPGAAERPRGRLAGIEAIRGAAASLVVLYHCARHLNQARPMPTLLRLTQCGHAGVDLFFVLSGFVILYVHAKDIGRPDRAWHYAERRLSRVVPTYWAALALTVATGAAAHHGLPGGIRLLVSASLLPTDQPPVLGVAWTLQYEAVFYTVFLALIRSARAGALLLALWTAIIAARCALPATQLPPLPGALGGAYDLEFLLGMAVAWHALHAGIARPGLVAAAGLCLLTATGAAEDLGWIDGYARGARLLYGVPSALLIAGVVGLDASRSIRPPRILAILGNASYSIYLFQFVGLGLAWQILVVSRLSQSFHAWVIFIALAGAALAGGVAASACIERPLLRFVRRGVASRSG